MRTRDPAPARDVRQSSLPDRAQAHCLPGATQG
jgi:hypothetical protein